jgi:PilZ domain
VFLASYLSTGAPAQTARTAMFDHSRAETTPEYKEPGIENRRHTRHCVAWPAICFAEGGVRFEATIVNASEGGFGLMGPALAFGVDSILYVDFDQIGTFRCRVAWTQENRFGVEIMDDQTADDAGHGFSLADALQSVRRKP